MSREVELHRYLAEVSGRPFEPGQHDCALFAAGWVDRVCGTQLVAKWQGRYYNLPEGRKMLRRNGIHNLRGLAEAQLDCVGGWAFCQPGDVALIRQKTLCFGIIGSGGLIHCLQAVRGLDVLPISRAWRVYRP